MSERVVVGAALLLALLGLGMAWWQRSQRTTPSGLLLPVSEHLAAVGLPDLAGFAVVAVQCDWSDQGRSISLSLTDSPRGRAS